MLVQALEYLDRMHVSYIGYTLFPNFDAANCKREKTVKYLHY